MKDKDATRTTKRSGGEKTLAAFERAVRRFIVENALLAPEDIVLVAVSGGPDSTALLLVLSRLAPRLDVRLSAAYFDHQLRGKREARRERAFVEKVTAELSVPLINGGGDVRAHAREKRLSIEESARELRYRFLAEAAADAGASLVAVGHTSDDQVETVLMHLMRGSGLAGLGGMLPRSSWPFPSPGSLSLIRPLLTVSRGDTEAYCRDAGLEPLEDASNRSPAYRRNRIRHEVLPFLRRFNPRFDEALLHLAQMAAGETEVLEAVAAEMLRRVARRDEESLSLDLADLREVPKGLRGHLLRLAAASLLGDTRDIGWEHLHAMANAIDKPAGHWLDLPRGLQLEVRYDEIALSLVPIEPPHIPIEESTLAVPGETRIGEWLFEARIAPGAEKPSESTSPFEARMDMDLFEGDLCARRRRPGDRYEPLGLAGEKKLQDLFVDAKVPRRERDNVPVIVDRKGIVWVAGHQIAERVKVTPSTRRTLLLHARREPGEG